MKSSANDNCKTISDDKVWANQKRVYCYRLYLFLSTEINNLLQIYIIFEGASISKE